MHSSCKGNRENTGSDREASSLESGVEAAWSGLAGIFTLKQEKKTNTEDFPR